MKKMKLLLTYITILLLFTNCNGQKNNDNLNSKPSIKIEVRLSTGDSLNEEIDVEVVDNNGGEITLKTNKQGNLIIPVNCDYHYVVIVNKSGYFQERKKIEAPCGEENKEIKFVLKSNLISH